MICDSLGKEIGFTIPLGGSVANGTGFITEFTMNIREISERDENGFWVSGAACDVVGEFTMTYEEAVEDQARIHGGEDDDEEEDD